MRSILLVALLGVAALAASSNGRRSNDDEWRQYENRRVDESSYQSDREYRYHFDGQLSAGIPLSIAGQHAIKRIQAIVTMQPKDDRTMLMQLTRVRFGSSQEAEVEPRQLQPFEAFEQTKVEPEHERLLQLPVRFTYRNGMVSELVFAENDETWSENVKRAVVNMLQVNILRQGKIEMEKRVKGDFEFEEKSENEQTWTAIERTLEGECEVTYTQLPLPTGDKQYVKTINFEKCSQRAEQRHYASLCEECEKHMSEERQSTSAMLSNVTVSSDNKHIVNDVEVNSQHLFAAINDKQKMLVSYVNNRLHLVYAGKIEKRIPEVQQPTEKQTLLYNNQWEQQVERFAQTGEEKYLPKNIRENKNKIAHITKLFTQLATQLSKNEDAVEPHVPHTFARIVKLLRFCTEEEIERVSQRLSADSEMNFEKRTLEKVRSMFYNALALAGTRVTVRHIATKVNKQEIEPVKAAQLLKSLVDMRFASPKIVEEILTICQSDAASRSPMLAQSCWLTYGAVINGVCGSEEDSSAIRAVRDEKMCPRELKKQYVRQIMQNFQSATSRYEKILTLKTLANAGIDMSIYDLQTIINDREETKTIRGAAIEATRRLTKTMPKKITQILMPIYADITEKPELRMLALRHVLLCEPEMDTLTIIVDQWKWREPSQQVRSFTYTSLKSIIDSTSPCKATFTTRVARLFAQMTMDVRPLDSRFSSWDAYSKTYSSGWTANWASIFTNDSILPNDILASFDGLFAGHLNKHLVQIGFQQHNMDQLLTQLFNKLEESGLEELVVRGKRSSMSMGNPLEMLSNLFNKLRISRRPSTDSRREPHGLLYIRHRDVDYAVVPFEKETLPEFVRQMVASGKLDINEIEKLLARGQHFSASTAAYVYESMRRIPTALGMPIELSVKMPTLATINGQLKTELEPRQGDSFSGVRVRLTARPSVATTHVTKIEAHCPIVSVGAKLLANGYVHMPIDTEITVNWHKKLTVKMTTKLPEEERRIAHFSTRPVTFVRHHKIEQRQYPEPVERTMLVADYVMPSHTVERVYFENVLGMRMLVSGSLRRPFFPLAAEQPKSALIADNHIDIIVSPAEKKSAKEINTWIEIEAFQPAGEKMTESPKFEDFFSGVDSVKSRSHSMKSEKQIDLFDTESYDEEEKENDETARRQSMRSYAKSFNGKRAYRHRVFFRAEDDNKERYVEAEIKAVCDEMTRFCKVNVDAKRSPMSLESYGRKMNKEEKEWRFEADIQTLYPEQPKSLEHIKENKAHRELQIDADFKWGEESTKKSTLRMRIQGEQSAEAKQWQRKSEKSLAEWSTLVEAGRLNQYKAILDYEMPRECRANVQRMFNLFHGLQFWQSPLSHTYEHNENGRDGHAKITLTIEPVMRRLYNLTVETPREIIKSTDMRLPYKAPSTQVYSRYGLTSTSSRRVVSVLDTLTKQAECVVRSTGRRIETFDDVIYKAPLTGCYSVLSKDCGSEKPKFAILAKSVGQKSITEEKKIRIITRKADVEIEMNSDKDGFKFYSNGKSTTFEELVEQWPALSMEGPMMVRIENEHFTCWFDGKEIRIRLNVIYKNKQCGLCGHYDGETESEFRRADNHETEEESMPKFAKSYLAKNIDSECSSSDDKMVDDETLYGKRYEKKQTGGWKKGHDEYETAEWENTEWEKETKMNKKGHSNKKYTEEEYDEDNQEPIKKTLVVERASHVCFSVEPQPACRREQTEEETEKETVEFRCTKMQSRDEKRIQRILKTENIVPTSELKKLEKTEEYSVRLPTKCSSNMRTRY